MKTKTIMTGIMALFVMLFTFSFALAENISENSSNDLAPMLTSTNIEDNATIENTTDISSGKVFWKEVGLWFTFNQERKMEKEIGLAQMKLQQAEFATAHNRTQAAEKALDAYEKIIARAQKRSESIKDGNVTDSKMIKLAAMNQAILVHQERITKLSNYLATANLTNEQKAKIEERLSKAENATAHLQEIQSDKEERMKTRLMAEGNLTEDEAEARISNVKDRAEKVVDMAKDTRKNLKNESRAENKTPKELMEERKQEARSGIRNETRPQMPNRPLE